MFKYRKKKLLTEEEIDAKFKDVELEKNDTKAMIIAALITFLPVMVMLMVIFYGAIWLIFMR
ncbi:hypothetical protein H9L01_06995 [Erysipelothrix inopinata]|uniref:Uncharacterized protein n=1 Tax=Erysipelothrix inopinata TaxID=225084 RepID=A0A7G9RWZ0_9FIRM|nr:hypothetical protein [Erysipelothrix inopinata]QNN60115.1 hypothetical protein H9L01_06995 [Erysipelothrix inopinata]